MLSVFTSLVVLLIFYIRRLELSLPRFSPKKIDQLFLSRVPMEVSLSFTVNFLHQDHHVDLILGFIHCSYAKFPAFITMIETLRFSLLIDVMFTSYIYALI